MKMEVRLTAVARVATQTYGLTAQDVIVWSNGDASAYQVGVECVFAWSVLNQNVISDKAARHEVTDTPSDEGCRADVAFDGDNTAIGRRDNILAVAVVVLRFCTAAAVTAFVVVDLDEIHRKALPQDIPGVRRLGGHSAAQGVPLTAKR